MPENKDKKTEDITNKETLQKKPYFGGKIDEKAKDFIDFRYSTQEQIDKLNEEMTTTDDLDEIMKQTNNGINIDEKDKVFNKKDKNESELDSNQNLESHDKANIIDAKNNEKNHTKKDEPIEGEVIEDLKIDENLKNIKNNTTEKGSNIPEDTNIHDSESETEYENGENGTNKKDEEVINEELPQNEVKFFDPFELNFDGEDEKENDENKETNKPNNQNFDPFELDEINEETNEKNVEEINNENIEEINDENPEEINIEHIEENNDENLEENNDQNVEEIDDEKVEEINDENPEETNIENVEKINDKNPEETNIENVEKINDKNPEEINNENIEEIKVYKDSKINEKDTENDNEDAIKTIADNTNQKNGKEKTIKDKKIKKNSATGEIITNKEIELEQGQDMPNTENDEEHQISAEELFEQEPEFFGDDELSQQFMQLVQNVRKIFKVERKNDEDIDHFKVLGGKTEDSTIEYLFYLIEEKDEPIDLYIKKVEVNRENEQESEHLVQFSYNEDKELNIFVDEIILYEKINEYNPDTTEYNDTKTILEKFIFLTENHYDKIKSELEKQRKEIQKKRQLQQIFKGF